MKPKQRVDLRAWLEGFVFEQGFLDRYPYYAHVIAALLPVADPSVPAMGLSLHEVPGRGARYYLHVNVDAALREPQFLRGILLHEVHHVVLGHLVHPKFFGTARPELMTIAQETSANEHIEEPLPSPILWQHFERFGFRAGQSTIERYELLCNAKIESLDPKPRQGTRTVDEHDWLDRPAPPAGGLQQTREVIEQADERGKDDAQRVTAGRALAPTLAGKTPRQLIVELGGTIEAPEVFLDWRDALRAFVARARAPLHTWSRPSRRFPQRIGAVPGRSYRPRPVLRPRLLVAIDTSLSMSERELTEIARQLIPLAEQAQLTIVECDTTIARTYPFSGAISAVKGRGGTDLRPVFEPSVLRAHAADGVVYFTDGAGPFPEHEPHVATLWVLTKPDAFACPWGSRALLTRNAPR